MQFFQWGIPAMTNDRQNGTEKRHVGLLRETDDTQASLATDDRRERAANNSRTNWAWAHGTAGYDWMDSHHISTDFTEVKVQIVEIIE